MKKIVFMLLAMVVFGSVFGASSWQNPLEVKSIRYYPYSSTHNALLLFSPDIYTNAPGQSIMWYKFVGTTENDYKSMLAILLSAKSTGSKISIFGEDTGSGWEFELVTLTE